MTSRDKDALVARIRQLAESGDYAGFNAVIGALKDELSHMEVDLIKRDVELRCDISDTCHSAWQRKHARLMVWTHAPNFTPAIDSPELHAR